MYKIMKRFLSSAALTVLIILGMQSPVHAQTPGASSTTSGFSSSAAGSQVCSGVGEVSGQTGCSSNTSGLDKIIGTVVDILSSIVAIAAVIMIVVAGLRFVISGGESQKIAGARNTIIFALIGLVVVALAQVIVHFVLGIVGPFGG